MFKDYLLFCLILAFAKCEVKFMIELFRHGARNPVVGNGTNLGELTAVGQR